jgi:hypothetical protein
MKNKTDILNRLAALELPEHDEPYGIITRADGSTIRLLVAEAFCAIGEADNAPRWKSIAWHGNTGLCGNLAGLVEALAFSGRDSEAS